MRFKENELAPAISTFNIQGQKVEIPDHSRLVHIQFRRYAGCPVCNLHLQNYFKRHTEIIDAGVKEVVVFHSTKDEMSEFQNQFPFDLIADPDKLLYRLYAVESSVLAILDPRAWLSGLRGTLVKKKPAISANPNGGILGLPAEFLIKTDGSILAAHYGEHADDQWSFDQMLELARSCIRH